jgi:hypothetical protein
MSRSIPAALATLLLTAAGAAAQPMVLMPGSTVQGDYLRGVGFEAMGMGSYNVNTAIANRIDTETAIMLNEYIGAVRDHQARQYWKRRAAILAKRNENYKEILQRIREHPEERDVQTGDALNAVMTQLLDPAINESTYRLVEVPLSVDVVRRIPFRLDSENLIFSMHRLCATGKENWPPALQDPKLVPERRAYQRALDTVLEEQIAGRMKIESLRAVEAAVDDLHRKLDRVLTPSREKLYLEAKNRLNDMTKTAHQLLQSHRMELIVGQLDHYAGTNVHDLLVFMQKNQLTFGATGSPEERRLYPELYAALVQQHEGVTAGTRAPAR